MRKIPLNDDHQLIKACIKGNRASQRLLYERYVGAMYHTIVRIVPNRSDAEDVTQETFIKVFQKLSTFKGESTLGAWMKKVAVNSALNHLRKQKETMHLDHVQIAMEEELVNVSRFSMSQIQRAIKQLPERARVVFNLYLLEGYQHDEIAQILSISESTSKSQYRRAKSLLKGYLNSKK